MPYRPPLRNLTTFIHSLPIAWLYFTHMTKMTKITIACRWDEKGLCVKQLTTNDTFWHWTLGFVLAALVIAPQVIVLAAQWRVSR